MKQGKGATDLIVDTDQLKTDLESQFKDKKIPITIIVNYSADGAWDANWLYGKIPIKHTNKIFKFGIYLLTGKAVILLIQDSSDWITQEFENILKKECFDKINCRPKKFYYNYNWLRQIDEFCGTQLTCYSGIDISQLQGSEKSFVEGLILEYQNLWIKKKGLVEKMEIKDKGVNVVDDRQRKVVERVRVVLQNGVWELFVDLDEAMNVNGLPLQKKLAILDGVTKKVMGTIKELITKGGHVSFQDYLNILEKHI